MSAHHNTGVLKIKLARKPKPSPSRSRSTWVARRPSKPRFTARQRKTCSQRNGRRLRAASPRQSANKEGDPLWLLVFASLRTADIGERFTNVHSLRLARLPERIAEAEKAVVLRARELFQAASDSGGETEALEDVMYALHALGSNCPMRQGSPQPLALPDSLL